MERSPQRVPRADVGGKPTGGALLAGLARTAQRTIDNDVPAAAGVDASSSIKTAAAYEWQLDAETARLTTEAFRGLSDYLHRLTNEPSIGLHHCTNHIGRAVPRLAEMQSTLRSTCKDVDAAIYDCTDAARAVCAMHELTAFRNTKDSIARSIAIVDQIQRGVPYTGTGAAVEHNPTAGAIAASSAPSANAVVTPPARDEAITFKTF